MQLKNVVLPAPLGPMSETMARWGTVNEMSLTATRPPKIFEMLDASSMGPAAVGGRRRRRLGGLLGHRSSRTS